MKTTLKSIVAKVMTAGFLMGALMLGAPKQAEAQQFGIGVQIGRPAYPAYPGYRASRPYTGYGYGRPGYYGRDYYARMRWEEARRAEWARRQAWVRHEQWSRGRGYGYYGR